MRASLPNEIRLSRDKAVLSLVYDMQHYALPAEYLRVFSPSAEVRAHAPGQARLQTGKRGVSIVGLMPVGNYALKITFSDGHDSGLYDWDYLYDLATQQAVRWADYEQQLRRVGASRDAL